MSTGNSIMEVLPDEQVEDLMEQDKRISGNEFAGEVAGATDYIQAVRLLFDKINPNEYRLKDLDNFQSVMVGVFARQYHLMIGKQRDYGPENITKAGLRGIVTRTQDKLERVKTLLGDPDDQIKKVQKELDGLDDEASAAEMAQALMRLNGIVYPQRGVTDENIEDTLLDLADYGMIAYIVRMDAWGKEID